MDQGLVSYIQTYLAQGYTPEYLANYLKTQGYSGEQITEAIQAATQPAQDIHISHKLIIISIIAMLIIIVGGISFWIFKPTEQVPQEIVPDEFYPTEPEEYRAPIEQPENTPEIIPSSNEPEQIPESEPEPPKDTKAPQSLLRIEQEVLRLAPDYPQDAAELCTQILTVSGKDACYKQVARKSKQQSYCQQITNSMYKDSCYLQFAIDGVGDESICSNIERGSLQSSCVSLFSLGAVSANTPTYVDALTSSEYT